MIDSDAVSNVRSSSRSRLGRRRVAVRGRRPARRGPRRGLGEKPFGCCTAYLGLRGEWDMSVQDFLEPLMNSNVQDLNLLLTVGVRF